MIKKENNLETVARCNEQTDNERNTDVRDVIVLGAGVSGCVVAGGLAAEGQRVLLVEKARGTGGRLSSKRIDLGSAEVTFDLGAQDFQVRHPYFESFLANNIGVVDVSGEHCSNGEERNGEGRTGQERQGQEREHAKVYVEGRNSQLARRSLGAASTMFGWRVECAQFDDSAQIWEVSLSKGANNKNVQGKRVERATVRSHKLVVATPPKQAAELLGEHHVCHARLTKVNHTVQWVVMLAIHKDARVHKQLLLLSAGDARLSPSIERVSIDSLKEGRVAQDAFDVVLLHASEEWSRKHVNDDKNNVLAQLQIDLSALLGLSHDSFKNILQSSVVHRWLYANPLNGERLTGAFMTVAEQKLWLCGDYYSVPSKYGVESAYLSARAVLDDLLCQEIAPHS